MVKTMAKEVKYILEAYGPRARKRLNNAEESETRLIRTGDKAASGDDSYLSCCAVYLFGQISLINTSAGYMWICSHIISTINFSVEDNGANAHSG